MRGSGLTPKADGWLSQVRGAGRQVLPPPPRPLAEPIDRVGPWQLVERVGRGGMGEV